MSMWSIQLAGLVRYADTRETEAEAEARRVIQERKEDIISAIKANGYMTVTALHELLELRKEAIYETLDLLNKDGIVERGRYLFGKGRPWKLTPKLFSPAKSG